MLAIIFLLAVTSAVFELMIAAQVPAWRRWSHKSKLFNLVNSMVLSYLIGIAFGAQGLIAMTSGIFSTFLTIPGYAFLNWNYDSKSAQNVGGNHYRHTKEVIKPKVEKTVKHTAITGRKAIKTASITGKVLFSPVKYSYKAYKSVSNKNTRTS